MTTIETLKTKKITMATVKSFVNKNRENLFIKTASRFSSMSDMVEADKDAAFTKVVKSERNLDHTMGIEGAWFVGSSRDYLKYFETENFAGIEVYNACGNFYLALKK